MTPRQSERPNIGRFDGIDIDTTNSGRRRSAIRKRRDSGSHLSVLSLPKSSTHMETNCEENGDRDFLKGLVASLQPRAPTPDICEEEALELVDDSCLEFPSSPLAPAWERSATDLRSAAQAFVHQDTPPPISMTCAGSDSAHVAHEPQCTQSQSPLALIEDPILFARIRQQVELLEAVRSEDERALGYTCGFFGPLDAGVEETVGEEHSTNARPCSLIADADGADADDQPLDLDAFILTIPIDADSVLSRVEALVASLPKELCQRDALIDAGHLEIDPQTGEAKLCEFLAPDQTWTLQPESTGNRSSFLEIDSAGVTATGSCNALLGRESIATLTAAPDIPLKIAATVSKGEVIEFRQELDKKDFDIGQLVAAHLRPSSFMQI